MLEKQKCVLMDLLLIAIILEDLNMNMNIREHFILMVNAGLLRSDK